MKVSYTALSGDVHVSEMQIGDIAIVRRFSIYPEHIGALVLRTYDQLVVLDDPNVTWDMISITERNFLMYVEILPPGTKITLEVE